MKNEIRVGIIGVGNCASALIQGINQYKETKSTIGLMHEHIGNYFPDNINIVSAFDIDNRKVGKNLSEAIFSSPNCTKVFHENITNENNTCVEMGRILDGYANHTSAYPRKKRIVPFSGIEARFENIINILKESKTDILINYLPVGSDAATEFYAECALKAKVGFINCIPVFIASDEKWEKRFKENNLPIIGDDIKSQIGATILHRTIMELCEKRGVKIKRTYQLNTGGNTDFLNMLDKHRLKFKKQSKTMAVQSILDDPLLQDNIHIGPSDYVPWQKDNKIAFIRIEGEIFGGVPIDMDIKLSVEDSPNSAGVVIDAIRCCKLALDRKIGGSIEAPSAYFMKHPLKQYDDKQARILTEGFING